MLINFKKISILIS